MRIILTACILFSSISVLAAPGLKVGSEAPQIDVKDIAKKEFNLKKSLKSGPVVLVFYRGGWCPYCNTQLRSIEKKLLPKVKKYKATVAAISVDKPQEGLASKGKNKLSFAVLSDPDLKILTAYNVKYKVPSELVSKYKNEYGIDLETSSGRKHHTIAIPAVYVIDGSQKIIYSYVNENYRVRAKIDDILAAISKSKA